MTRRNCNKGKENSDNSHNFEAPETESANSSFVAEIVGHFESDKMPRPFDPPDSESVTMTRTLIDDVKKLTDVVGLNTKFIEEFKQGLKTS